jgi:3-oxoacyl-[acyl-carrier-protein] synthase II
MSNLPRVVITGVGLTSPNGNDLPTFRKNLLAGVSGVKPYNIRYVGDTVAGICDFEVTRHQKRKEARRGTRAGSISVYCAREALEDAGLTIDNEAGTVGGRVKSRIGTYIGITEHGNVETENEVHNVAGFDYDLSFWSHHHNPRTVANNPAGEVTLNLGLTGPAYCLGGACAAGNLGLIHGMQMLQLGEVDLALAGGVSEAIHTFGIFASFASQGALGSHEDPTKASRPFDLSRNGIVVSEGGCLYTLERMDDAVARSAKIYGEVIGYHVNSDASDFVLPNAERQAECMTSALEKAGLGIGDVDLVNTHATSTSLGDLQESDALRRVFGDSHDGESRVFVNNTKSFIGHTMGAAGALELAGNLPAFDDKVVHASINVENLDPGCAHAGLVLGEARQVSRMDTILNLSFGMLGINSAVIIRRV